MNDCIERGELLGLHGGCKQVLKGDQEEGMELIGCCVSRCRPSTRNRL